jgi:hypothetical protein
MLLIPIERLLHGERELITSNEYHTWSEIPWSTRAIELKQHKTEQIGRQQVHNRAHSAEHWNIAAHMRASTRWNNVRDREGYCSRKEPQWLFKCSQL